MTSDSLFLIFHNLQSAFPNSAIALSDRKGTPLFYCNARHPSSMSYSLEFSLFSDHNLRMTFSSEDFPISSVPERMVHALLSLVESHSPIPGPGDADSMTRFAQRLIAPQEKRENLIPVMAANLGIDLNISRIVCVLQVPQNAFPSDNAFALLRKNLITRGAVSQQDILASLTPELVLYACAIPNGKDPRKWLTYWFQSFSRLFSPSTRMGVGYPVRQLKEYRAAFLTALCACKFPSPFSLPSFAVDYPAESIIALTPQPILEHFLEETAKKLAHTPNLAATALALNRYDLNVSAAATALHIHKNTVVFRFQQLKKLLNMDPVHCDHDRFRFILLCLYMETSEKKKEGV
ncbi:hypothetical protein B5E84_11075 [Lachnoclostridium sp. An14]|uniref:PucR family transcriptional regulator n=1 Tax=Lachnoclostridium sp. An14 TaxID=1965562 RepID=UPI000B389A4F|nr:helix-turn-helix domain-containing protein [Lachnoclostridium sp. An14]OUQ16991.1 hypothetical protein B5E84_11075 [Lachnoclostridium sp. An14]